VSDQRKRGDTDALNDNKELSAQSRLANFCPENEVSTDGAFNITRKAVPEFIFQKLKDGTEDRFIPY